MTKKIMLSLLLMSAMSASIIADNSENDIAMEMDTTADDETMDNDITMDDAEGLDAVEDMDANEDMPDDFGDLTEEQLQEIMKKLQENPEFAQELENAAELDSATLDDAEESEDDESEDDETIEQND